jgi:hypothetical protein
LNDAIIVQTGLGTAALPNVASISQASRLNTASIMQSGGGGNHATIRQ